MSSSHEETPDRDRFGPHAVRELGGMFDDVSGRYDLLNRIMSLGQDRAWRVAMWQAVPGEARAVLDLCTGSGVSLPGLRRPGRLVLGVDVSLGMLELAADRQNPLGWAPRLVCADAFHLPIADGALDAVTIAFGIRNLRPLADALAELRRVLAPGGTLVVLEAAAPAPGPFAPFHAFYLRHLVPLAGRLSPDPSAYEYLSRSVFAFGAGPEFEVALGAAGFRVTGRRSFLAGATRLWVASGPGARLPGPQLETGQFFSPAAGSRLQIARPGDWDGVNVPSVTDTGRGEWRAWTGVQLALSVALAASFVWALSILANPQYQLPLAGWHRPMAWFLTVGGLGVFSVRSLLLLHRILGPGPRR
jgi:demethylmenaquinone methyltransferase/2-methoxy-6-polyprenyl-1,4-benzoquinol methylase